MIKLPVNANELGNMPNRRQIRDAIDNFICSAFEEDAHKIVQALNAQGEEFVPNADVLKKLNNKQTEEILRLMKARKRLADAYRKLRDESIDELAAKTIHIEELEKALEEISSWTMHSGVSAYENCEQTEHYNHAYYLMEAEISKAKTIAKAALGKNKKRQENWITEGPEP